MKRLNVEELARLCEAVRTLSPHAEIRFRGVPDRDDYWVCIVVIGDVILFESAAAPLPDVTQQVTEKIKHMSQRMKAVLDSTRRS